MNKETTRHGITINDIIKILDTDMTVIGFNDNDSMNQITVEDYSGVTT